MLTRVIWGLGCLGLVLLSCSSPCRLQAECPSGAYCEVEVSGQSVTGECKSDCIANEDCPADPSGLANVICDENGRCTRSLRRPSLRILSPENDTLLPEGTQRIRIVGEVTTAAESAKVTIDPNPNVSCSATGRVSVVVRNSDVGREATLPFAMNDVDLDPGQHELQFVASANGTERAVTHLVEVPCSGCAQVLFDGDTPTSVGGLVLPAASGEIVPGTVTRAIWRVRSELDDVFDGAIDVFEGRFHLQGLPLFAGMNRVQVIVTGIGDRLGESRCTRAISSGTASERGLRAILTWDRAHSDLDLHIVGPSGQYGDPASTLWSRGRSPSFGGDVHDDFDGLGPEILTVDTPPEGTYGLVVEPVVDDGAIGSNAILRLVFDGRTVIRGPIGPLYVSALRGYVWLVGTLTVENGRASWRPIDALVESPPTTPPDTW